MFNCWTLLVLFVIQCQCSESILKSSDDSCVTNKMLEDLKQQILVLQERISKLENNNNDHFIAPDATKMMVDDHFVVGVKTNDSSDEMEISLQDKITKFYYSTKVNKEQLQQYGFSNIEVFDLSVLSEFILNAINQSYSDKVAFSVLSKNNIMSIQITIIDTVVNKERQINIPLQTVQRNKVDILEEHVIDLQQNTRNLNKSIRNEIINIINTNNENINTTVNEIKNKLNEWTPSIHFVSCESKGHWFAACTAKCPDGFQVITGSCRTYNYHWMLYESAKEGNGWTCKSGANHNAVESPHKKVWGTAHCIELHPLAL
eukprot:315790_1